VYVSAESLTSEIKTHKWFYYTACSVQVIRPLRGSSAAKMLPFPASKSPTPESIGCLKAGFSRFQHDWVAAPPLNRKVDRNPQ